MKKVKDLKGKSAASVFVNSWSIGMTEDRNPGWNINGIQQITLFKFICRFGIIQR